MLFTLSSCDLILDAAVRAAGGYPKDLITFSFTADVNNGAGITTDCKGAFTGTSISVSVPYGTSVTALVATFTTTGSEVRVGSTIQVSGVTPNDFTNPVTYIVTAEDSTTRSYVVTVTVAPNPAKDITAFKFEAALNSGAGLTSDCVGIISGSDISLTVPYGTSVTALVATFTTTGVEVRVGATVQESGVTPNDFTNSVMYIVVAADSTTKVYTVNVTVNPWHIVGTAGFSAGEVRNTSLAIDSSDTPYLAYQDYANSRKVTVMKYASGAWQTVGAAGFSAGEVGSVSLAIDSSDTPYVAYYDSANDGKATVMKYVSGAWQAVGTAGFSADEAGGICLELDPLDTPYVAFSDDANSWKATVMKYDGGVWQFVGAAGFSTGSVGWLSLALDSSGTPYVAFEDGASGYRYRATVMRYESGTWQTVGVAGFSAGNVSHVCLELDALGTPFIAYRDHANSGKTTVMKYTSGAWQTVGVAGFSAGEVWEVSLAMDAWSTPYVAYDDYANSQKATVMKYASGMWQTVGVAGFSSEDVAWISLALDTTGTPYISYQDKANGTRATVMTSK